MNKRKPKLMVAALSSPRCLAKNRAGNPCQRPAMKHKRRCNLHGGAAGSGAQRGNRNALKHGHNTAEAMQVRRLVNEMLSEARNLLE